MQFSLNTKGVAGEYVSTLTAGDVIVAAFESKDLKSAQKEAVVQAGRYKTANVLPQIENYTSDFTV